MDETPRPPTDEELESRRSELTAGLQRRLAEAGQGGAAVALGQLLDVHAAIAARRRDDSESFTAELATENDALRTRLATLEPTSNGLLSGEIPAPFPASEPALTVVPAVADPAPTPPSV